MALPKSKTGIPGFDELLDGGIPSGTTVLVSGATGTGKSLFGWHFLYSGAKEFDEPGIYLSLEERPRDLRRNLSSVGWDIESLEERGLIAIVDAASSKIGVPTAERYVEQNPFDIDALMYRAHAVAREIRAKRLVMDSVPALSPALEEASPRESLYRLNALLLEIGCTTLLVSEEDTQAKYAEAEHIASGLVHLELEESGKRLERRGIVVKMRGSKHSMSRFSFEIGEGGIKVTA